LPSNENYNWNYEQNNWLSEEKLKELGFDTSYPLDEKDASRFYSRQIERQGYVVLEYNGGAYQKWSEKIRKLIKEARQGLAEEKNPNEINILENDIRQMEQLLFTQSRLFTVDAGADPQKLRKQHPDKSKTIITPAVFDISRDRTSRRTGQPEPPQKYYLRGWVRAVSIPEIHVTSNYRSFFISDIKTHTKTYLPRDKPLSDLEPRYQVTLNYGKRHEPWIADVQKLK
jgi:hypothetical protein